MCLNKAFMKCVYEKKGAFFKAANLFMLSAFFGASFSYANTDDLLKQPPGWVAPLEVSNKVIREETKIYRPWFVNGSWMGDLIEYDVGSDDSNGSDIALSTTISLAGGVPSQECESSNGTGDTCNWSAHLRFKANEESEDDYWKDRNIIFLGDNNVQRFFSSNNIPSSYNLSGDVVDYVRGNRSQEKQGENGGTFRARASLLGDIQHSNPVYVGGPAEKYKDATYKTFKTDNEFRASQIIVGANDGMLHIFDADTGDENYAYVPSMVIGNLEKLTKDPYEHTYFVDGGLVVRDAYLDGKGWRTVLVGGLGAGGKGIYALDVTCPNYDQTQGDNCTGDNKKILWEFTGNGNAHLGYTYGRPTIAKLNDGKFYAVFGNGYKSNSGKASLYIVELSSGDVTKSIEVGTGQDNSANGLSAPALVDENSDGMVDFAYAGDLKGNLWKFDLSQTGENEWKVAYAGSPLIKVPKPITVKPDVARHPQGGYMVYFGTGKLIDEDDANDANDANSQGDFFFYGVRDNGKAIGSSPVLLSQISQEQGTCDDLSCGVLTNNQPTWVGDTNPHHGWELKIESGFMHLTDPVVRAKRVKFTITDPSSIDKDDDGYDENLHGNSKNYDVEVDYLTGGRADVNVFGKNITGASGVSYSVSYIQRPNGLRSAPLIVKTVGDYDAVYHNSAYLLPPPQEPEVPPAGCISDCEGGFVGAHIDVDTDIGRSQNRNKDGTSIKGYYFKDHGADNVTDEDTGNQSNQTKHDQIGLGGQTSKHQHEYDKEINDIYVDYLNIRHENPAPELQDCENYTAADRAFNLGDLDSESDWELHQDELHQDAKVNYQRNIEDGGACAEDKFIIVFANADLSPGGIFQVGHYYWNVLEYQKMIHEKLSDWDGEESSLRTKDYYTCLDLSVDCKGSDYISLIFSLNDAVSMTKDVNGDGVEEVKGTIRITFNSVAAGAGGLHPSDTSCVRKASTYGPTEASKNRYRDGALMMQVIKATAFSGTAEPLNEFTKRYPKEAYVETVKIIRDNLPYEVEKINNHHYGSLVVKDNKDFIHESTLFWHEGGCYAGRYNEWLRQKNAAINVIKKGYFKDNINVALGNIDYLNLGVDGFDTGITDEEDQKSALLNSYYGAKSKCEYSLGFEKDAACSLANFIDTLFAIDFLDRSQLPVDEGGGDDSDNSGTFDLDPGVESPIDKADVGRKAWFDVVK